MQQFKPIATDEIVGSFVEFFQLTVTPQTARHGRCQSSQIVGSSHSTGAGIVVSLLRHINWNNLRTEELPVKANGYPGPIFAGSDFSVIGMKAIAWFPCRSMSLTRVFASDFCVSECAHFLRRQACLRL